MPCNKTNGIGIKARAAGLRTSESAVAGPPWLHKF